MKVGKQIINQILREYSVCNNEFTQFSDSNGVSYRSSMIKDYMITIVPECQDDEETGRILVRHTDGKGRIQYIDTWIVEEKKAIILTRDTPKSIKCKTSYFYVKEIEQENIELYNAYNQLKNEKCVKCDSSNYTDDYKKLQHDYDALKKAYEELKESYEELECVKSNYTKKKMGRPMLEDSLTENIINDCNAGIPKTQIAKKYGIERKTIYNILKRQKENDILI